MVTVSTTHVHAYNALFAVPDLASKLDSWLYRHPFEGDTARRYTHQQRPGFGDLDARLIRDWDGELAAARAVLDVGAGPGAFGQRLAAAHPHLTIVEVEPSRAFDRPPPPATSTAASGKKTLVRARAEALPLADASFDLAVCLSSIRHVGDRHAALRELRRVVRPDGCAYIIELDPGASWKRIRHHGGAMRSRWARLAFGPLVVKTAPAADIIATAARRAGWHRISTHADPLQPVYIMRLSP